MAVLNEAPLPSRHRAGVRRARKHSLKTDMTPMVDLGFLLIAFFIMTTQLSKPVIVNLNMPHEGPPMKLEMSNALTVLLGDKHTIWYYEGDWEKALASGSIIKTSFDIGHGIGQVIREKQAYLEKAKITKEGRNGLMLLIKPTTSANYEDVVKMLDETLINQVKKYALEKPETAELEYVRDGPRHVSARPRGVSAHHANRIQVK